MPKRILIIVTKGEVGGAQAFVYNLAKGLRQKGLDVTVGFGEGDFLGSKLAAARVPAVNFKYLKRTANPLANILFILELRGFLKRDHYDVVHFNSTNALFGAVGAKSRGAKTVFTFHGLSVLDENYKTYALLKAAYRLVFKFLLHFVDKTVFVCEANLKVAERDGLAKNASVIYNGLDAEEFEFLSRDAARDFFSKKTGLDLKDRFIIGSVGRLSYPKNYEFLISAFPNILAVQGNALAVIVGDGPQRKKYENLIREKKLQDRIFLCGELQAASSYLRAFDLFVLPSRYEGLSISLIETLFSGIPAVASDVAGNAEIIGKEFCYPPGDVDGFVRKIRNTADMVNRGDFAVPPAKREEFSLDKMLAGYEKIL